MSSAALLVDRFVSASSADDAKSSLERILNSLLEPDNSERKLDPNTLIDDDDALESLLSMLRNGEYKGIQVDQGRSLVCQVYIELCKERNSLVLLQKPSSGKFILTLLDVICNSDESSYTRVLAIQLLRKFCIKHPSTVQTQILEAPNGLHRLADTIRDENEQVRNEVLFLSKVIAKWASCAKIWVFSEVCDSVLDVAIQEGGLTEGHLLVVDCIEILISLLSHESSLADLVCQSVVFTGKLSSLLDLRRGIEFLSPKKPSQGDDLDEIIASKKGDKISEIPRLTQSEESLLARVIDLIGVMLQSESLRKTVWQQHLALGSLMWELSLIILPPLDVPHVCAFPSTNLQQMALNCVGQYFASMEIMNRHNGLDRLMYIVCTGGQGKTLEEKFQLSQSALHIIRKTLPDSVSYEIVMHSLAPPISDEVSEMQSTPILKLLNTIAENLSEKQDADRRKINIIGSLGALSLFMSDATSRELMLRITASYSLVDEILKAVNNEDEFIALSLLRFLTEWMQDCPKIVEAILSSSHATSLGVIFGSGGPRSVFTGILLGVAMEFMDPEHPESYGGWSKKSIFSMISNRKGGISSFMNELDEFKHRDFPWSYCPLEKSFFLTWYNNLTLLVRGRIIQELSSTTDGGLRNESSTSNSLETLVSQQAHEIVNLRKSVEDMQTQLASSERQLGIWKQRVETAPTKLDELLSEYSNKNEELERKTLTLSSVIEDLRDANERDSSEKNRLIDELKNELKQIKENEQENELDADRLRGELSALSAAYSHLEDEFNAQRSSVPTFITDSDTTGKLQEGHESRHLQVEIEALRNENIQLRNDAKAADEWMQLAHQRLGELNSKNNVILEEVATYKKQMAESSSFGTVSVDQALGHHALPPNVEVNNDSEEASENKLKSRDPDSSSPSQSTVTPLTKVRLNSDVQMTDDTLNKNESEIIQDLRSEIRDKSNQIGKLENDLKSLKEDVSKANSFPSETLEKEISTLKTDLLLSQACATSLNEERRQWELMVVENESVDSKIIEDLRVQLQGKNEVIEFLEEKVKALNQDLLHMKQDSEKSESRLNMISSSSSKSITNEETERELEELRATYSAAQEWMQNAVQYHESLSDQVSTLQSEKAELERILEEEKEYKSGFESKIKEMQEKLSSALRSLEESNGIRDGLEIKVKSLEKEVMNRQEELENKVNKKGKLPHELEAELLMLREVRLGLDETREFQELRISELQSEVDTLTKDRDEKQLDIDDLTTKLKEFESWSEAAQNRLHEMDNEKEALEDELLLAISFKEKVEALANQITVLDLANQDLKEQLEFKSDEVIGLHRDLEQQKGLKLELEKSCELLERKSQESESQMLNQIKELERRISDLDDEATQLKENLEKSSLEEESTEKLKLKIVDLESNVELLDNDLLKASEEITRLNSQVNSLTKSLDVKEEEREKEVEVWKTRCTNLAETLDDVQEKFEDLANQKEELDTIAIDAQSTIDRERKLNESLSLRIKELESEIAILTEKVQTSLGEQILIADQQAKLNEQEGLLEAKCEYVTQLEMDLNDLRKEFNDAKSELNMENNKLLEQSRNMAAKLADLEQNERDASSSLNEWKQQCSSLEEDLRRIGEELENENKLRVETESRINELLEQLQKEHDALALEEQAHLDAKAEIEVLVKQSEEAIVQWQDVVSELESQLEQQQLEAIDAIKQWEGECDLLHKRLEQMESVNRDTSKAILGSINILQESHQKWIMMIGNSSDVATDLDISKGAPLHQIPSIINAVVETSDRMMVKLVSDMTQTLDSRSQRISTLEDRFTSRDVELKSTLGNLLSLESSVKESGTTISILKEKCADLELDLTNKSNRIADLELDLKRAEEISEQRLTNLRDYESQLQKSTTKSLKLSAELTEKENILSDLLRKKGDLEQNMVTFNSDYSKVQADLVETEKLLDESRKRVTQLDNEQALLKRSLEDKESRWEMLNKETIEKMNNIAQERDLLEREVVRLEEELRCSNEFVQGQITDRVTKRATDMASLALREEMERIRAKMNEGHHSLIEERRLRVAAEKEISSLKADLTTVLRARNVDGNSEMLKSLVMKTADDVQKKERFELEELRQSLDRSLAELDALRCSEKDAVHRATVAELQASICEQEIIAAKADIAFLTQALEEGKEAEAARTASFEYRITALQEDRDVVRRFHADELESLRHSLSHCSMEKDHILHSLKESEKANAALVYSSTRGTEKEDFARSENELSILRSSNAHLLASISEEASRTERRIREAIIASASLVEAEVILERELRIAAETALENVKSQLNEDSKSHLDESNRTSRVMLSPGRLQSQLSQSRERTRILEAENMSLKRELENLKADMDQRITELTNRCQRAQSLALKLESEVTMGSDISDGLKVNSTRPVENSADSWIVVSNKATDEKMEGLNISVGNSIEAFDFIMEQRKAIQEERQLYQELLAEHDDLLALLAQQDLEKRSLQEALLGIAGQSAIDVAIQNAEANAVQQFGKYIRLFSQG